MSSTPLRTIPVARAIAQLNERIAADERVDVAMLAIADGVTLALKRG